MVKKVVKKTVKAPKYRNQMFVDYDRCNDEKLCKNCSKKQQVKCQNNPKNW